MLTYSEGFVFLEAVALQILMFSWRLVSYDGEIHCVIVMKRALRTVAQIDLSPDDVTQLFAWRGSIGDTFCNHLDAYGAKSTEEIKTFSPRRKNLISHWPKIRVQN